MTQQDNIQAGQGSLPQAAEPVAFATGSSGAQPVAGIAAAGSAAEGDIVAALNIIADKLDKIAARPCCCCGGQGKGQGTIAYVQCAGRDRATGSARLASYHAPLTSQAEADTINTLIYLGETESGSDASLGDSFTLDGFTMPGTFPVDIGTLDSFPLTLIRSKDGTGWLSLTSPAYADNGPADVDPTKLNDYGANASGFCFPNYHGKVFGTAIIDPYGKEWTKERRGDAARFSLKGSPFYQSFPITDDEAFFEFDAVLKTPDGSYTAALTWGEVIDVVGDKFFYVTIVNYDHIPFGIISAIQPAVEE
ncbi:hypothetical protein [Candidatus Tokpelaia sp.]|uniref:hypothetical protein n=1 Tax=Candidatus Tokpelaia sp. TaxID=2233777 RepID=UPI001238A256|nr:hypothetical protein [Candidatus Tokpelaia sp.]KAA6405083.1 hypothetical protein DPQ22_05830 [Candidatus Tokpelaia sp.]